VVAAVAAVPVACWERRTDLADRIRAVAVLHRIQGPAVAVAWVVPSSDNEKIQSIYITYKCVRSQIIIFLLKINLAQIISGFFYDYNPVTSSTLLNYCITITLICLQLSIISLRRLYNDKMSP